MAYVTYAMKHQTIKPQKSRKKAYTPQEQKKAEQLPTPGEEQGLTSGIAKESVRDAARTAGKTPEKEDEEEENETAKK